MPVRTILVPLDGSKLARQAVPFAAVLAKALGARLHLLSVQDDDQTDLAFFYQTHALRISQEIQLRLARYLELVQRGLTRQGVAVDTEVVNGQPAAEIVRAVERTQAGLIALSTHGRSGLGRWAQGSVAEQVLRAAPVPALVLRPGARPPGGQPAIDRVLVPLDGSAAGEAALPLAGEIAAATGARVTLAQVVPSVADLAFGPLFDVLPANLEEVAQQAAEGYLKDTAAKLGLTGSVAWAVLRGDPARHLLQLAEDGAYDLIVMATHGRTGLRRALLGSVAARVMRDAGRPVVLVRPPGHEAD
jgi:nucleotide-binding universal stress UspA family protein